MNETPINIQYVLTDELQQEVITRLLLLIKEYYVFPAVAEKVEQIILGKLTNSEYTKITDPRQFSHKMTIDLQNISGDKHLALKFLETPVGESEKDKEKVAEDRKRLLRLHNFGFDKVERLPGNIGYHKTTKFIEPEIAGDAAVASLNFLTNTSAIIFDLRENTGGDAGMVALICSYLFKGRVHLNNFYWRKDDRIEQVWTNSHTQGKTLYDKDVFILTSRRTFSGAEDFAYNLKALKRATIVGERTNGGAHPGGFRRINDHFSINIPIGRAVNPITNNNWEAIGVVPHIEVSEEQALNVAQYLILKKLLEKSPDADIMGIRWKKIAEELEQVIGEQGLKINDFLNQMDFE